MSDQPVLFSRAAASCRLTLNREDKCHAINEEMIESLDHYLNEIENDTTLRLVELTATGDKFFCAGGDIKSWSAYSPLDMGRKWIKRGNDVFNRLRNLPQLTVANLNGHTIGGGIELALCCDIRIARPGAKFSNPEVMLGMVPGWMGIERVLNQVGPVVGRQMLMLGKRLTAQEAQAANLIDEVVEKEQVESWMANQLAQLEKCGPVALAHIKQLILALENKHADYPHQLLAAHNSGGKVFVQVRDVLEAGAIEPRRVKLPGILVDGIVEHREQPQTYLGGYDLTISGQHRRLSSNDAIELVSHPVRRLIARRAARELVAGASTNFGFGIPGGIPGVALREGVPYQSLWLSVEQGVHNGMMLDDALFGCARNADAIIPSLDQFEFYSGGGIDITFLGMGEMDQYGNVNVSHLNGNLIGPGGFLEIAQNARKVVFCGTFDAKGSKIDVTPDGLHIAQSGQIPKLVTQVEKITFSAAYAQQSGQEVLYITERAVFQLTAEGVELIEIAPSVEIERDILPYMAFRPIIKHPRLMESSLFTPMEDA